MSDETRKVRVFVSSPGDVAPERRRVDAVAAKLNREYEGLLSFETVLWEDNVYKADSTFQAQIPQSAAFDIVVSIFWTRIGTELPADFAHMPDGRPYLSGTAYELLTALEASKQKGAPDVYVFRKTADAALPTADAQLRRQAQAHLDALEAFWSEWFKSEKGQFKAAYQVFVTTDDFEHEFEMLCRQWLQSHDLLGPRLTWPKEKGSPFRGLEPFEAEHAPVFFGRDRATDAARRRFVEAAARGAPFLLVVGASGSGKSSLARAGVIPRLTTPGVAATVDLWRVGRMKPSEAQSDPLLALATALFAEHGLPELGESDFPTAPALAGQFRRGGEAVAQPLVRALERAAAAAGRERHSDRPPEAALVLLVDQLEELFARGIPDADRAAFVETLAELAASGRIWIVATLRADSYELAIREGKLKALKELGATFDLGPPGPAELADIVRAPARAAGFAYEVDPAKGALDDRILADAASPDSLPLLQFALQQLYVSRVEGGDEARLTHEAYDALGGLAGAIAAEAERAVSGLRPEALATLPKLLRRLAEPSHVGRTLVLREALIAEAAADPAEAELLEALKAAFVVIAGTDAQGRATARLAHAAVFESWPRAKKAAETNRDFLRVRAEVEDALRRWRDHGRPADRLIPPGVQLAEAEDLVKRFSAELSTDLIAFVGTSGNRARRRQRLERAALAAFIVIAAAAILGGFVAFQQLGRAREALAAISQVGEMLVLDVRQEFAYRRIPTDLLGRALDPAIRGYDEAILLDPNNAALRTNRGAAYGAKEDYDRAIRDHDEAIRLDPRNAFAYRNRGIAYDGKGDHDRAIQDLGQAIALDPAFASAYLNRAFAYKSKGDVERAIQDFDEAIRLVPNDKFEIKTVLAYDSRAGAYMERAERYHHTGDDIHALEDFGRAIQDDDQAIRLDPKYALAYGGRALAYEMRALIYERRRDYDRIKPDYDRAIQDFDQEARIESKDVATTYVARGAAYEQQGNHVRAIEDFDEATRLNPTYADAYRMRAHAYQEEREYGRAIQDLDQAIQFDPRKADNYVSRGQTHALAGDFDRAIQDYEKSIELDPNNASAYSSRGLAYTIKHDFDSAIRDYDRAIELDPKSGLNYAQRCKAYFDKRDYDRAIQDCDRAIQLDAKIALAFGIRGDAYEGKLDHDRAIQDYNHAIQLDPKNAQAYKDRGNAYLGRGDADRALQDYDQAIGSIQRTLSPTWPAPSPTNARATSTARSGTTIKPSSSIRKMPSPTTDAPLSTSRSATTTAPSKTSIKRSSSIQEMPSHMSSVARLMNARANTSARSRTPTAPFTSSIGRSDSTRMQLPIPCGALRTRSKAITIALSRTMTRRSSSIPEMSSRTGIEAILTI